MIGVIRGILAITAAVYSRIAARTKPWVFSARLAG
jgi:hypothetical protein